MVLELLANMLSYVFMLFGYISSENLFPEPLSKSEEQYLLKKHFAGDKGARHKLIEHNLRLVAHIAKKYASNNQDNEEYISIGTIGLIKGIDSFSEDKGFKLSTYCSRCVENAHFTLRNYMTYSKKHSISCKTIYKRILP